MSSRTLITTALESTWVDTKRPIVFLGRWCLRHSRKKNWEKLNYEIAEYHWDDRHKLYADYHYLNVLYESLLHEMQQYLNKLHGTNHSLRYWRIQLGPWMGYFLPILFDRWSMLRSVQRDYNISELYSLKTDLVNVLAIDTAEFAELCLSDRWNEFILSELAAILGFDLKKIICNSTVPSKNKKKVNLQLKSVIKIQLSRLWQWVGGRCTSPSSVFIMSSYLSLRESIVFQLKLGQIPTRWFSFKLGLEEQPNTALRRQMNLPPEDFSAIALSMIKRHIPIVYAEGYDSALSVVNNLPWPSQPRSIVTAISWAYDDVFKLWAGRNVEHGSRLITIQHGGNYGVARWNFFEEHQVKVSDRFLTWGWEDDSENTILPFCNIKLSGRQVSHSPKGRLLLIGLSMPVFSYHMYSSLVALGQWEEHFTDQVAFLRGLSNKVIDQTTVRLNDPDYGCSQIDKWNELTERFPIILEVPDDRPIEESFRHCRICVSTYNATVFLETMALGIPTMMFWNPDHWELRDGAVEYFDLLKEVAIFHTSPASASKHLERIWHDVDGWWSSDSVVEARAKFCHRYSRSISNKVDQLASISLSDSSRFDL